VDHSTLFVQNLLAGITTTVAGELGDTVTTMYGNQKRWTLHVVIEGSGIYTSDRVVEAQPGDILLVDPAADCQYRRNPACDTWVHAWVVFQPRQHWTEWMRWPVCGHRLFRVPVRDAALAGELAGLVRQILRLGEQGGRYSETCSTTCWSNY